MARNASDVRTSRYRTASFALLLLLLSACAGERTYPVEGRVVGFGDERTLIVEHGDVNGLMPAMTMPFTLRDASADTFHVGDAIAFLLHIQGDSSWINDVRRLPDDAIPDHPAGAPDDRASTAPALLQMGDPVPEIRLITHADTTLEWRQLEGIPVVLTFIYTRCPLPDFCPRMTDNFVRLQNHIRENALGPVHLLSISFDPGHDTPAVLRDYAARVGADFSNWTFATADSSHIASLAQRFGVYYQTEGGEIVHNLSTALVAPDGTIRRIWRGNEWTVEEIVRALRDMQPG